MQKLSVKVCKQYHQQSESSFLFAVFAGFISSTVSAIFPLGCALLRFGTWSLPFLKSQPHLQAVPKNERSKIRRHRYPVAHLVKPVPPSLKGWVLSIRSTALSCMLTPLSPTFLSIFELYNQIKCITFFFLSTSLMTESAYNCKLHLFLVTLKTAIFCSTWWHVHLQAIKKGQKNLCHSICH